MIIGIEPDHIREIVQDHEVSIWINISPKILGIYTINGLQMLYLQDQICTLIWHILLLNLRS